MTKLDEIELRHKFEANARHDGLSTALSGLGRYADPAVQAIWQALKDRVERSASLPNAAE